MNDRTTPWRLMLVPPRSGAENMARDSGLMDRARETGEGVVTVYEWSAPTLSLGRNQTAQGRYDLGEMQSLGVDVVRRPTGGRALLHHREITYSVTGPAQPGESLSSTYREINKLLIAALATIGVKAAESQSSEPAERPGTLPCFATPAEGELVADGAKLVGSAQLREDGAFLQHGSMLIADDQALIERLLITPEAVPLPGAATLSRLLGRVPAAQEVAEAMRGALSQVWNADATAIDEREAEDYAARHIDRYRSELWTWRK
jgi:lipoate-protein ligase A